VDNLNLDFRLCGDLRRDNAIRPLVKQAIEFVLNKIGASNLEAVVLTGSLARGEGSVLLRKHHARLLGDIEFLVIVRGAFDWRWARNEFAQLSRRATEGIGQNGYLAKIEFQPAGLIYLRKNIRPSIFAYELFRYGRVVSGRSDILEEIRPFGTENIPKEDALNLLMNRFVELMLLVEHNRNNSGHPEAVNYQVIKTILDLAGSALAFTGQHVPLYAKRKDAFRGLLASDTELQGTTPALETIEEQLDMATRCKLAPTVEAVGQTDGLNQRVETTLECARALWLWEMRRLLGRPKAQFKELVDGYLRQERLQQRLKGWAKFYLHPLRPVRTFFPARASRLLFQGSPQRLTYAVALMAHGEMGQVERNNTASFLPVPVQSTNGTMLRQVGDTWRWLIRNN